MRCVDGLTPNGSKYWIALAEICDYYTGRCFRCPFYTDLFYETCVDLRKRNPEMEIREVNKWIRENHPEWPAGKYLPDKYFSET